MASSASVKCPSTGQIAQPIPSKPLRITARAEGRAIRVPTPGPSQLVCVRGLTRLVSARTVDGWDLAAHRTQIRGELAAMMDPMLQTHCEEGDSGFVPNRELNRLRQFFGGEFGGFGEQFGNLLVIPCHHFGWGFQVRLLPMERALDHAV